MCGETVCGMHFDRQKTHHPFIWPYHDLAALAARCTPIAFCCNKIDIPTRGRRRRRTDRSAQRCTGAQKCDKCAPGGTLREHMLSPREGITRDGRNASRGKSHKTCIVSPRAKISILLHRGAIRVQLAARSERS